MKSLAISAAGVLAMVGGAAGQMATLEFVGPGTAGGAAHINDHGEIVTPGVWDGERFRIAVYSQGQPVRYVDPPGFDHVWDAQISNTGQVAFTAATPGQVWSMRYTPGVGAVHLNSPEVTWAYTAGINVHGEVAMGVMDMGRQYVARWREGIGMEAITTPTSSPGMTHAAGINDRGQIAGTWEVSSPSRAVRYTPGIGIEELGTLGEASVATRINAHGDVLGWSSVVPGESHWFLHTDSGGMMSLGLDTHQTTLMDMNDHGWIVGAQRSRAIVWTARTGPIDINTLLPPGLDGILHGAAAVNNAGQIAAYGRIDDVWGIYRITVHEIPAPSTALLLGLGMLAAHRRRLPART